MGLKYSKSKNQDLKNAESNSLDIINELHLILQDFSGKLSGEQYALHTNQHAVECRKLELIRYDLQNQERLFQKEEQERLEKRPPAFNRWLWGGFNALDKDEKEKYVVEADQIVLSNSPSIDGLGFRVPLSNFGTYKLESRSDVDAGVKKAVADQWSSKIVEHMSFYGNLERICSTFRTNSGGNFIFPSMDDNPINEGIFIANQSQEIGLALGKADLPKVDSVMFTSYLVSSGPIRLRRESITDVSFNLFNRSDRHAMRRMSSRWNKLFINGTGNNQPEGLVLKASSGLDGGYTANAVTHANPGLSLDQFLQFLSSVPDAYMDNYEGLNGFQMEDGQVACVISTDLEKSIKTARTSNPAWFAQGVGYPNFILSKNGNPGSLLSHDYYKNGDLKSPTVLGSTALIGHFGYFGIRTIGGMELYRFWDSRTAQSNAIEVIGYTRRDSRYMGALNLNGNDISCEAINKLDITALEA